MKKFFIYFLCFSFLLLPIQAQWMIVQAKEKGLPIGEMTSKGSVKFEIRENVWKQVESSHFPLFIGTSIRTEGGQALLLFSDNSRVEVSPKSLFSIDKEGRFVLKEGSIKFYLPGGSDLHFKTGTLSIVKGRTLQASKGNPAGTGSIESTVGGTISLHPNGSVTVKTSEGKLNILGQDNVLLSTLSKNESVTIPSSTVAGLKKEVLVAQAGGTATAAGTGSEGTFLGISTWGWVGILAGAAVVAGVAVGVSAAEDDDDDFVPLCP